MKLSILIPSNRPDGLTRLIDSLKFNSVTDDVELVVLVDDELEHVEYHHNMIVIHYPPKRQPLSIAHLLDVCYRHSTGDWIMFGNDDIVCNTPEWDKFLFKAIEQFGQDGICMFWPDDCMFGPKLACFPIVSRKLLDLVGFFPQPYRRYKVDDTLFNLIPNSRRYFLSNIQFKHYNDSGKEGYQLGDGRIYPIVREDAEFDNEKWISESARRAEMKRIVDRELGVSTPKIVISVITQEMSRRADFYDCLDNIVNPPGCEILKTKVHAQSPAKGRNLVIEQALSQDCTHILFLDDDVYPPADVISRLLSHDKDIVTGLYLARHYPHRPYIFDVAHQDGSCVWKHLSPYDSGLIEVVGAGLGICLIKTSVFQRLEKPWIRLGELAADDWCDDLGFFKRVREAGIRIYCDLDCQAGHTASFIIYPKYINDKWFTSYWTASNEGVPTLPQVEPVTKVAEAEVLEEV